MRKKRSSSSSSSGGSKGVVTVNVNNNQDGEIEWELRPGGMLVQKRSSSSSSSSSSCGNAPLISIKVSHGSSYHHDISVPAQSTFGDLKRVLAIETGLEPKEQRLLFRGKEKEDYESLHMVGVKDMSKVVLLEDPASKERKLEEMKRNQGILIAYEAVAKVRAEVDRLSEKVAALERALQECGKFADKEAVGLTELLMMQLLKLDSIDADGEAKVQRKIEVRRVQTLVDTLDNLKARNCSNPFISSNSGSSSSSSSSSNGRQNAVSVTTKWEKFKSGFGSLNAPKPIRSSAKITQDWELFD